MLLQHERLLAAERDKTVDFDSHSKSNWHAIVKADKMKGSLAWEASPGVIAGIQRSIKTIVQETPKHASLGTKKSALYTLRKMCKTILMCKDDTCGREVFKSITMDEALEVAMLRIADRLSEDEKTAFVEDEEWLEKVEELMTMGDDYGVFGKLEDLLDQMAAIYEEDFERGL